MGLLCCKERSSQIQRMYLTQKWNASTCIQDKSNVIMDMILNNILPIKNIAATTLIDRRQGLIVKGGVTYKIVFCDNIREIKDLESDKEKIILITNLSYHEILNIISKSIIVFDYYQIEDYLQ
jgi:hypothetical protein